MKIMKFGGTSVGRPERMHEVARLITRDDEAKIVVLSALSGTTNSLVAIGDACAKGDKQLAKELIDKLAALDPLPIKFVFRDSAFKDDINLKDETFRRLKNLIERNAGLEKKSYTVEFI